MTANVATVEEVRNQALTTALVALKKAATITRRSTDHHEVDQVNAHTARELVDTAASAASIYHALG